MRFSIIKWIQLKILNKEKKEKNVRHAAKQTLKQRAINHIKECFMYGFKETKYIFLIAPTLPHLIPNTCKKFKIHFFFFLLLHLQYF